jgi:hypothetical protein
MRYNHFPKLIVTLSALWLLSIIFFNSSSYALTYSDDFDDNFINSSFWRSSREGVGALPLVSQINHQLQITIPSTTSDIFGAGYISTRRYLGDFDAQVDFTIINLNTDNCGFSVNLRLLDIGACVRRCKTNSTEENYSSVLYPAYPQVPENINIPTGDFSGSLRMVRSGTTITNYFLGPSGWIEIGHCSDPRFADFAEFALDVTGSWFSADPHQEIKIAFDNFIFNYEPQPIPIPTAIILFGSGLFSLAGYEVKKRFS